MTYYKDLREYIQSLEKKQLLRRIKTPVKKETEISPMVRWQFRGLEEEERTAFLFEHVIDVTGGAYDVPVLVGALAGSSAIYAAGMMCEVEEIGNKWAKAQSQPIAPKHVKSGPAQEEVHAGSELTEVGLDEFPFPVDVPGFEGVQRATASCFFSKDPETGVVNIGTYSGCIAARNRMVVSLHPLRHMATYLRKAKKMGKPLEVALVLGAVPAVGFVSVSNVPYEQDELAVAGGLAGEAIEVVRCRTVDLEVPATAEIVIEGEISTEYMELQTGSFGESSGYMATVEKCCIFDIKCITHRKHPILMCIISQMPPSESSKIRQIAFEQNLLKFLKYSCNLSGVTDVALHESSGSSQYCVIQLKKTHPSQARQALHAAAGYEAIFGKILIAVDDDIDPRSAESVNWALSFRMQPHRDTEIIMGRVGVLDPSTAPPGASTEEASFPQPNGGSALLIDATRRWDYLPVSLPAREYMERAKEIWEAEGLPRLKPRVPWHGYSLGYWPEAYEAAAQMNLQGKIYDLGEMRRKERTDFSL